MPHGQAAPDSFALPFYLPLGEIAIDGGIAVRCQRYLAGGLARVRRTVEPRRYDILALRDSCIACLPRLKFNRLLNTNLGFNRFLLVQLNERLGLFIGLMENERLLESDVRVARSLGALFNPVLYPGVGRQLQISQEEIGLLAGVSRQRVNQALQVLEKAGLLRVEYGGVLVTDLSGLQQFGTRHMWQPHWMPAIQ